MYRSLDADKIIQTVEQLNRRIAERFPDSGLNGVARDLVALSHESKKWATWISQPNWAIRAGQILVAALGVSGIVVLAGIAYQDGGIARFDVGFLEAGMNVVVIVGVALIFVLSLERRRKRDRALSVIHQLRSIAHVIDMHQLSKDPEGLIDRRPDTPSSPRRVMSAFELTRYFDYCSEMLSLVGKRAALCVQEFDDSVALAAVTEVETLTTGLSRKIWQKAMIVHTTHGQEVIEAKVPRTDSATTG